MLKPLRKYLLVKPAKLEEEVGGLIVPNKHQDRANEATVLAKGEGVEGIKIGDVVVYDPKTCELGAIRYYLGEELHWIMHEKDLLGVK